MLGVWMGRRRDATGAAIAGKDAPADLFRRVSNETNEMMDYRAGKRHEVSKQVATRKPDAKRNPPERRVAQANPKALSLPSPATWHLIPQAYTYPGKDELWVEDAEELLGRW